MLLSDFLTSKRRSAAPGRLIFNQMLTDEGLRSENSYSFRFSQFGFIAKVRAFVKFLINLQTIYDDVKKREKREAK